MDNNTTEVSILHNTTRSNLTHTVELYSVIFNFGSIFILAFPGIVINVGVLTSTRCKKSIRNIQYGLHYTLFAVNIMMGLVWLPLHTTQLYKNYQRSAVPVSLCYLTTAVFHFCLASTVFLVVVLGVLHLHHLSSSPLKAIHSLVKRGILASLFTALLVCILLVVEYPSNVSYEVCSMGFFSGTEGYKFWYSLVSVLLSIAYTAMLLVMMVLLWLAIQAIRQRIHEMVQQGSQCHHALTSTHEIQEDTYEFSREEPSKHSSVTFKEPDIAETIPDKNGISKVGNNLPHKSVTIKHEANKQSNKNEDEEEEDDDDTFDLKMRLQLQKSSSGRRHTVANIGIGDGLFGSKRRGSLDVQRSPTTHQGYNYIRKWSVDITALQNQLENPKVYTGSYPFRELGILPEKDNCTHENDEDEHKSDEESVSAAQSVPKLSTDGESEEHKHNIDFREPLSVTEVPSIVVDDSQDDSVWQDNPKQQSDNEENNHIDEEIVRRFHKQLKKSKRFILFYLLTLFSVLPCLLALILQGTVTAHFGVNLVYVTSPLCLLAGITQPLLLVWIDTRLSQAVKRLWNKMTHWKCVCYCNIGEGKNFFGKPAEIEDKSTNT